MYVVMGATGHVGSAVAKTLLAAGQPATVLTRHPEKARAWQDRGATIAFADADDPQSMRAALEGASRVFVLNPPIRAPTPTPPNSGPSGISCRRCRD